MGAFMSQTEPNSAAAILQCLKRHRLVKPTQCTEKMSRRPSFCVRESKQSRVNCETTAAPKLSAFEVPEQIYIVADFPRTAKGSTDRQALALQFTAGVPVSSSASDQ
jgi:acyl-CoA synthetase (AMP-forming)/AMP-acid ligase II